MRVFLITILYLTAVNSQNVYTMQDLEILYAQQDYAEYLDHAKDVIPSKRNKKWNKMTLELGTSFASTLAKRERKPNKSELGLLERISRWSLFKSDENFNSAKRPIALWRVDQCLLTKDTYKCQSLAKQIFNKDPEPVFGIDLATKLKAQEQNSLYQLKEFITPMLRASICSFYINKSPMKEILAKTFEHDPSSYRELKLEKDCRSILAKKLLSQLYQTQSNSDRQSLKQILQRWGKLHSNDIYFYNMAQFLDDHKFSRKKILTKWKTFKTLGSDHSTREIILKRLYQKRPLAGKILYNNSKESKAIFSAIKRYAPEYFTYYANRCLEYYKGLSSAPSADCHQLFKKNKENSLFSNNKALEYKKIMSSWKQ